MTRAATTRDRYVGALQSCPCIDAPQLAARLDICVRTVRNELAKLRRQGFVENCPPAPREQGAKGQANLTWKACDVQPAKGYRVKKGDERSTGTRAPAPIDTSKIVRDAIAKADPLTIVWRGVRS